MELLTILSQKLSCKTRWKIIIVLTGDQNGLELNSKYVKETIVECELGIWGPKKKLHL